ncbi:MAG TPA: DUF2333 family protein [Candidatus Acidoferrales bacterium]|nr:DUF2333 family protein [Candidatus Acidoferrales bacterium]
MSQTTLERPTPFRSARSLGRIVMAAAAIFLLALCVLGWHWSREPAVPPEPLGVANAVVGDRMTRTLIDVAGVLLDKPGGYLSNDVLPPGVWLDNMPNWEFGVLVQIRDLARALRNDFSRSQSQSREDPDLAIAEPQFNFDSESWLFPPSEGEYRQGIRAVERYRKRLIDPEQPDAQFYARSDNLRSYLAIVEKRLGDLSQRLSASAGVMRVDTALAGDSAARQSTERPAEQFIQTPWLEIDDVFYEARGASWALLQFLRAAETDFAPVLARKNAQQSMRQIIRELEEAQQPLRSPVVLNGSGYGLWANHSLVLSSYLARAHSAIIDLRELLEQG